MLNITYFSNYTLGLARERNCIQEVYFLGPTFKNLNTITPETFEFTLECAVKACLRQNLTLLIFDKSDIQGMDDYGNTLATEGWRTIGGVVLARDMVTILDVKEKIRLLKR